MIAAFSRAIAVTVDPSRSMWSRSTLVIAATPPSQAWVASSRPPSPTSTTARSTRSSANQRKATAVSSSNSVGGAGPAGDPSRGVEDLADEPGERRRVDEPAVDLEPLAIAHQVRLGGLGDAVAGGPQRRPGEGEDAALPVRAADERAAEAQLRVAELAQERPGPAQPEPDPETTAVLEGLGAPPRR